MKFELNNVTSLAVKAYMSEAQQKFGDAGRLELKELLDRLRSIFTFCDPHNLQGRLTIVGSSCMDQNAIEVLGLRELHADSSLESAANRIYSYLDQTELVFACRGDGEFTLCTVENEQAFSEALSHALSVSYFDGQDFIKIGNFEDTINKVSPLLLSNFAQPTYSGLDDALRDYAEVAAKCRCKILHGIWDGSENGPRLILSNKPESLMRDSLHRSLQSVLKNANVKMEQNTDEKRPVDIAVYWWPNSRSSALIEIKWLGWSKSQSKNKLNSYTKYSNSRAQDGADQLAEYLELERQSTTVHVPKGYHVVFDARRRNLKDAKTPLSRSDALAFRHEEVAYDPDHSKIREDFAPPVRFFLEPRENHFAEAKKKS